MKQKNLLIFLALTLLLWVGWINLRLFLWPPPPPPRKPDVVTKAEDKKPGEKKGEDKKEPEDKNPPRKEPPAERADIRVAPPPPETPANKLLTLGSRERGSRFHIGADLDPRGAGVRRVVLNKFQQADDQGRPVWQDEDKKVPQPLELVGADANRHNPSFLMYHYDVKDPTDPTPLDTLGRVVWKVVRQPGQQGDVATETFKEGDVVRLRQKVTFEAEVQGVVIDKTYSVTEGDYHLGLVVRMRLPRDAARKVDFHYQLTGGHGLPVEGRWYTSTFRNALIGLVDSNGYVDRHLQDLRQISLWAGGHEVGKGDKVLRYAGVAVQYFASVIAVDDQGQDSQNFLSRARPTLETAVAKGAVKGVAADGSNFVLTTDSGPQTFEVVDQEARAKFAGLKPGSRIAVIFHSASAVYDKAAKQYVHPQVATEYRANEAATHALWEDDITVRVMTEPRELNPGDEVVHRYLLYNGPVKVKLLGPMPGDGQISQGLVDRYTGPLHLDTLTDYQSPGVMGTISSTIFLTNVIIKCTNVMHWVLGYIHWLIPSYGLCIIVLTVLVRGMMFPVSRKQAMTTMRMQELAPELKKMQEKYKDDRQALGMAQMELYRKHGVNPFGTCWFLLLQMPIFMGLYFALQESINFRLATFWPLWIKNLAAPDMLFRWGESIPWLSTPESYGGFLYLGPYFNLLPVIAVSLMIAQQKMMTPPPADEQQEMQQKMMKYMMVFFGLMFYKVAAGLCVYFIASSAWGFAERKLLPKKKLDVAPGESSADGLFQGLLGRVTTPATGVTTAPSVPGGSTAVTGATGGQVKAAPADGKGRGRNKAGRNKRRDRGEAGRPRPGVPAAEVGDSPLGRLRGWWRERRERLHEWWTAVLKQAQKK